MSPTTRPLNERLRRARLRAGISQTEAAAAIGYQREYLSRFEHGKHYGRKFGPTIGYRLARLLNVRFAVDELFADDSWTPDDAK